MEPELYKITSINEDGVVISVYSVSPQHTLTRKMMSSEYGNAEMEKIDIEDAPQDVREAIQTREQQ